MSGGTRNGCGRGRAGLWRGGGGGRCGVGDGGGNREGVGGGEGGFVAGEATVEEVGRALERAWVARERWRELGLAARRTAQALYDANPGRTLLELIVSSPAGTDHWTTAE